MNGLLPETSRVGAPIKNLKIIQMESIKYFNAILAIGGAHLCSKLDGITNPREIMKIVMENAKHNSSHEPDNWIESLAFVLRHLCALEEAMEPTVIL